MIYWEPIIWQVDVCSYFFEQDLFNNLNYIFLGEVIFVSGFFGLFLKRQSLIFCLISIEAMLIGLNMTILFLGKLLFLPFCQLIVLVILLIGAAETALGLTLIMVYFHSYQTTKIKI
jgi:NADH-quinone oxidoreductase subunit K